MWGDDFWGIDDFGADYWGAGTVSTFVAYVDPTAVVIVGGPTSS